MKCSVQAFAWDTTRRATQNGTIFGMVVGLIVNLILWQQPGPFAVGHAWAIPKIAFIWYVLIGAMITTTVGYIVKFSAAATTGKGLSHGCVSGETPSSR